MVPVLRRYSVAIGVCCSLSGLLLSGCVSSPRTSFDNDPATRQAVERAKGGDGTALQSLREAADAGRGSAAYAIGLGLAEGWAGPPDIARAVAWWQRAAEQGDLDAMNALGVIYAEGIGVAPDSGWARRLWQEAAAQGHVTAQYNLGSLLVSSAETRDEMATAAGWLRQAAEQGDGDAQYFLANLYDSGEGVPRQPMEALRLWREAASHGHADAAFSLGEAYLSGTAVPVDVDEAKRWMRRAADAGHPKAAETVALLASGGMPAPVVIARRGRGLPARVTEVADASDTVEAPVRVQRTAVVEAVEPPQPHYKAPAIHIAAVTAVAARKPDIRASRAMAEKGKAGRRDSDRTVALKGAGKPAQAAARGRPAAVAQNSAKGGRVILAAARTSGPPVRAAAISKPVAKPSPAARQVAANAPKARPERTR